MDRGIRMHRRTALSSLLALGAAGCLLASLVLALGTLMKGM